MNHFAKISNYFIVSYKKEFGFAAGYTEGVELAEAVRSALDYSERRSALPPLRSCTLTGGEEGYEGDAYVQELVFTLKI